MSNGLANRSGGRYTGGALLLTTLQQPAILSTLDLTQWRVLIGAARQTRLLARLGCLARRADVFEALPVAVRHQLDSAATVVAYHQRHAQWELNRLYRVLHHADIPVVLIKGGAYLALELELSCGREMRDIDLLIPQAHIDRAEQALRAAGWGSVKLDDYDQHYYRQWMHELPPMRHPQRSTEVDLHHTILPRTARLHPDPTQLFKQAQGLPAAGLGVLCPHDLLLHMAVHLFYDGALDRDLRDLVDIDALLRHFATHPGFWDGLVARAATLDLGRPLYYALRYAERLLHTPIPAAVRQGAAKHGPGPLQRLLMDQLVPRALLPSDPARRNPTPGLARWLLYLRSHWLRMPPLMLAKHLFHKGVISVPGKHGP